MVCLLIPTISIAFELAKPVWPSYALRNTGLSGTRLSRYDLSGIPPGKNPYCHPLPFSHFFSGCFCANAAIADFISCKLVVANRSTFERIEAPEVKCMCASLKPGTTRRPCKSITWVSSDLKALISSSVPAAMMVLPFTAKADTKTASPDPVQILPLI